MLTLQPRNTLLIMVSAARAASWPREQVLRYILKRRRDATPPYTDFQSSIYSSTTGFRKSPMPKALDEMFPKRPFLVLARAWLWSNRGLKIGLGRGIPPPLTVVEEWNHKEVMSLFQGLNFASFLETNPKYVVRPPVLLPIYCCLESYLFRQLSRRSKLYTEMYVDKTLLHQQDNLHNFLYHRAAEGPLAVQLGGNDPDTLAEAAEMCEQWAFSEINLNCGCPSSKVSDRCFGARLMLDPERVREITYGMIRKVTRTPVTIKCRIGVDDKDSYDELTKFVRAVKAAGVDHVVVHARKCLLKGLSTSANRTIPPLRYDVVHRLAKEFPELEIVLNGGIDSLGAVNEHIAGTGEWGRYGGGVAGVMVGRAAYFDPWTFRHTDSAVFGSSDPGFTRREIMERCVDRFTEMMQEGRREGPECNRTRHLCLGTVTKPLGYLSSGARGSRTFRQELSRAVQAQSKIDPDTDDFREAVDRAMALLPEGVLDEPVGDTPECALGSHVRDDELVL